MHAPAATPDVLIVGAGPAGLALALALADRGFAPTVLEAQPAAALADPAPDGRDIALTHRAQAILRRLGLWERLPADELAPLREAVVYDGGDPRPLRFDAHGAGTDGLGHLVANHVIRRASWQAVQERADRIGVRCGVRVTGFETDSHTGRVLLRGTDGTEQTLAAPLVVAADSRFSELRRRAGIGAQMRDFGRSVIVCRMAHDGPNDAVAQECFHAGHTIAVLPMNGGQSSIVVTLPADRAAQVQRWPDSEFTAWVEHTLGRRLGAMRLAGERHLYPLVGVFAHRFAGPRIALVGDAAVGMHPVTAHGYNFGLYGVERLADTLAAARAAGRDIGSLAVLAPYADAHRAETAPIYHGTNLVVGLFTDDRLPARLLRRVVLHGADLLPPVKRLVTERLTRSTPVPWPTPPRLPELPKLLAALRR